MIERSQPQSFRRDARWSARGLAEDPHRGEQSEIDEFSLPIAIAAHVARRDVPMQEAVSVEESQRRRHVAK